MIPERLKIYHITHTQNITSILKTGALYSDARRSKESIGNIMIGISEIKRRRLEEIHVLCCPDKRVGDFVPFYFCPRSIMLYIIFMGNHADLKTVEWAARHGIEWAFSTSNAGARYTQFFNKKEKLNLIDWDAVTASDFRDSLVKDKKQAEFLFHDSFPLHLVDKFATINEAAAEKLKEIMRGTEFASKIVIEPSWYF